MNVPSSKTLLFAEDEPELLQIYAAWFQGRGYKVLSAGNGKDAFSLCQREHVDLVISDVRMAAGDGIELASQLKTNLENSPLVVFLTGFADVSSEEAYDLGVCTILNKPIARLELVQAVERFLKPPRELWTASVDLRPNALVQKNYGSFESALNQGALNFGRGGMFVRGCESLPEDLPVEFQFQFSEGRTPRMDGCGILRWKRTTHYQDLPNGAGIEILRLESHALDVVTEWISRARPKAFIPRA